VTAQYQGRTIAGAVYFHFGNKALYKYGASDHALQHLRANNLVMWEAIKWFCQSGFSSICLGRTKLKNNGLLQFKAGWGAQMQVIKYYKYDVHNELFFIDESQITQFHHKLFNRMPNPLLNIIGSVMYRHVG